MIPFFAQLFRSSNRRDFAFDYFWVFSFVRLTFFLFKPWLRMEKCLIVCLQMHRKRNFCIGFDLLHQISLCSQCRFLLCHSKLKSKTIDGWLTKVHMNGFLSWMVNTERLWFRWFKRRSSSRFQYFLRILLKVEIETI